MVWRLQFTLFIVSILFLFLIIKHLKKAKLTTDIAVLWIIWGIGIVLISVFPSIVEWISKLLGIVTTINTLFLIMIFLLYCLVFYLFIKVSDLENKVKNLTQYIALTEKNERNERDKSE